MLLNKVGYFVEEKGWDVVVVTTDQHERPSFYPFPEGVRMIDLGVNYSDDNGKPFHKKLFGYFRRRCEHKSAWLPCWPRNVLILWIVSILVRARLCHRLKTEARR